MSTPVRPSDDDLIEAAARSGCYGCGQGNEMGLKIRFERVEGGVVGHFAPRPDHRGGPGMLHGGVAATALDETMAALGYVLDGVRCVTATLSLRYRRPVPLDGRPVRVEAWRDVAESRRRQRVSGRLLLESGEVAVEASGIFVQVPGPVIDDAEA